MLFFEETLAVLSSKVFLLDIFPMSRNFYYIYTRYLGSWLAISDSKGSLTHTATATTPGADAV
ncbi:MAG: hypothetical protein WC189_04295, partial [Bacilli bacterium]